MKRLLRSSRPGWLAAAVVPLLGGCARRSPTIDILGSYFPAWLVCFVVGLIITVVVRLLLIGMRLEDFIGPKAIVYPAFLLLFAMLAWLLVYSP